MPILPPILDNQAPITDYDPTQSLHTPGGVLPPIMSPSGDIPNSPAIASTGDQLAKRGLLSHALGKEIYAAEKPPEPSSAPGTIDWYKERGQQLEYDKEHPWGSPISPHPGVLGKIFHGLATAGNIAGDIFAPGTMALIPGTQLNRSLDENANVQGMQRAEQEQNQETEAGASEENANTAKERADTEQDKQANPEPKFGFEKLSDGSLVQLTTDPHTGNSAVKLLYKGDPKVETDVANLQIGGKPHAVLINKATGATIKDLGESKEPVEKAGAGDARSDKSYQYNQGRLDKIRQPIDGLVQRFGRLQDTLNQKNPQADALVAPEMLSIMAGGQGSGLRMNEAEISRILGGRSAWENLRATMQHWATDPTAARSITPEQDKQIRALVGLVGQKLTAKQQLLEQAQEQLLNSDDPKEHRRVMADAQKQLDAIDGGAQQGATQRFTDNGRTYNIPADQVAEFKKDHPNAR